MAPEKPDDTNTSFGQSASRLHTGDISTIDSIGNPGQYAYRLVHTQKSIWLLDLRLDFSVPQDITDIGELLGAIGRHIVGSAILDQLSDELQSALEGGGVTNK